MRYKLHLLFELRAQVHGTRCARVWLPFASDLKPIIERLDCTVESWLDLAQNFRRRFRTEAGRPEALAGVSTLRRNCRTSAHKG